MIEVNKYDMSINLLKHAQELISNASLNLKFLQEGTAFNQVLNDEEHIISSDELIKVLDKFAEQHPQWKICIETNHGSVDEKFCSSRVFYEGMDDTIVLDFE